MARIVINRTLDGVTPFNLFGRDYTWTGSNGNIDRISAYVEPGADTYDVTYMLSGNQRIRSWELWYFDPVTNTYVGGSSTTIQDLNDGGNRRIDFLRIADGTNTLTLNNTVVETITSFFSLPDTRTTITLGAARTGTIDLGQGRTTVNAGSGTVNAIILGVGDDRVVTGSGFVRSISTRDGNDTVIVGQGSADFVHVGTGNDTVQTAGAGRIRSLLADGNVTVTMAGDSRIEQAFLTGADVRVTMTGNARIFTLKTGEATNRVTTGEGFFESCHNFAGTNVLTIGAGGAAQITLSGTSTAQSLTADGFVGSFQTSGTGNVTAFIRGGAGEIRTDDGADRITQAGSVGIATIRTGSGDDTVTLSAGGATYVELGEGNDILRIAAMDPARGIFVSGGSGVDTLDFARITRGVHVDLSQVGAFQNFGRADGQVIGVPGVIGYLSIGGIENLTGTAKADRLTGRETANALTGGGGNDTLSGLAGDDVLRGGNGNDSLIGGAGADDFLFGRREGTDRIADFELGADQIGIAGVTRLGQITFTDIAAGVRLVANGTTIIVEGLTAAEMRSADNFLF